MDDPYTTLQPGDRGKVSHVDDTGTIFVAWDSGSGLGVVYGVDFVKFCDDSGNGTVENGDSKTVELIITDTIFEQIMDIRRNGKYNYEA
jgi:hypothetical protein